MEDERGENDDSTALPLIPVATPFLVNAVDPIPSAAGTQRPSSSSFR